jgi:hypothetical protein
MLKYLTKKPSAGGDGTGNSAPAKPRYRGPDPQKNRYEYTNIEYLTLSEFHIYLDLTYGLVIDGMV